MNYVKSLVAKKEFIMVAQFVLLVAVATLAPLTGHQQLVTGPIVNATLFISAALLGAQAAILVGLIPSLVALSAGLLPAVLAPMVPFIMMGNTILVLAFNLLRKKNYWLAVVLASFLKFIFLAATSSLVIDLLLKKEVAQKVALMMNWPQLLTALAGGVIAFLFLKSIRK